jgi:hypothetical protein
MVAVQLDAADELGGPLVRPALRGRLTRAGDGGKERERDDPADGDRPLWPQQANCCATQEAFPFHHASCVPGLVL